MAGTSGAAAKKREELGNTLLKLGDEQATFLLKIKALIDEYRVVQPSLTIQYENIVVEETALLGSSSIATVGSALINIFLRIMCLKRAEKTTQLKILDGISGVLRPGRITLLLGPPSCGKTTFMKLLSGRLKKISGRKVSGTIKYNGVSSKDFIIERTINFVEQYDNHNPNLTVIETMMYAFLCQNGASPHDASGSIFRYNLAQDLLKAKLEREGRQNIPSSNLDGNADVKLHLSDVESGHPSTSSSSSTVDKVLGVMLKAWGSGIRVDVLLKMMGLTHCKDVLVGDQMTRGVSGGERKRLTCAEIVTADRHASFMDEISTGLDSATLFSIIRWFRQAAVTFHKCSVVSLLQPPPETFQLFDDVIMIAEGIVFYHGPVSDVLSFFSELGFECPSRKDVPSFLLEITTPAGQMLYANDKLRERFGFPSSASTGDGGSPSLARSSKIREQCMSVEEMSRRFWQENKHGLAMKELLKETIDPSTRHPQSLEKKHRFALSPWESISLTTQRQFTLMMRDKVLLKGRMMQTIVLGLITGSLFYQLPITYEGSRSYFGACFMSVLFLTFGGFPQMPMTIIMKQTWYKHRDNLFIPAYAQGLAIALVQIPISLLESVIFSLIMYFMVGFYMAAGRFFTFFLISVGMSLNASALFRFIGCIAPDNVSANALGGVSIVILIITSGFVIVRDSIPPWMIWAYWISPFSYSLRSLVVNEFTTSRWQNQVESNGQTLGDTCMLAFGFYTEPFWIWVGVAFLYGSFVLLTFLSILALHYLDPVVPCATVPDAEEIEKALQESEQRYQALRAATMQRRQNLPDGRSPPSGVVNGSSSAGPSSFAVATVDISSSLPFQPITLVFKDIFYSVPNPSYSKAAAAAAKKEGVPDNALPREAMENLNLLQGLTGYAEPGVLTALMGGSGAGKTTLMDVIAGRKTIGTIKGEILVNGHPKEQESWSRVVGYCEQFDIHSGGATVREALFFSARLRLPSTLNDAKVNAYIDEVMEIVDLTGIQYNLVGEPGVSGLNMEQRKRLTIAVELVTNPSCIFMDEPTSSLAAGAAMTVMQAVRNVARNGRTVIVTIHQPSIEIFEAFDMLMLIQRGGKFSYFGQLGTHSSILIDYLRSVPGTPELPAGYNPATWMLEVTGGSMATLVKVVEADWPQIYYESETYKGNIVHANELVEMSLKSGAPPLAVQSRHAQPFWSQYALLLAKFNLAYWRNPAYNFVRLGITLAVSLLYGTTYYKQGVIQNPSSVANIQNVVGIMFSSSNFLGMTNLMSSMALLGSERVVFYREQGSSMYDAFAYGFALAVVEMPYLLVQSVLFVPIMYWMVCFKATPEAFFQYFIIFFETIAFYTIFGQFLVFITPNPAIAQVIGATFNFLFNVFNGFVITYPAMPSGWRWMNRLSPPTWILYGLGIMQLGDSNTPVHLPEGTPITVAQFMDIYFGMVYWLRWWCVLILLCYILFFRITSILALKYWNFLRR